METNPKSDTSARTASTQKPMAFDREKARRAADGLRDASRGLSLSGITIKALIEEGRQ